MALNLNNPILKGSSGALGKTIVFKQFRGKTIISRYPDMSRVKPSAEQKARRSRFREAVAYAKEVCINPELKAAFQRKARPGQSAYHAALAEFLASGALSFWR